MKMLAATLAIALSVAACSSKYSVPPQAASQPQAATAPRPAFDLKVFGIIELGRPLTLPPCDDPIPTAPCIQTWRQSDSTTVYVPALQNSGRYRLVIETELVDGTVEIVRIRSTDDFGADTAMLADLKSKYGEPTWHGRIDETFADAATWELGTLNVSWRGRGLDAREGTALVETPKGRQFNIERRSELDAATPKL